MADKIEIIKKVYHDPLVGFQSVQNTYKEAKRRNKTITLQDVKDYLKSLPQKQLQFSYKGYNSFVVNDFLDQIQVDVADFTRNSELNNGFRYALVGIDVFSRYGWAVKMKSKKPEDIIPAFTEIMEKIGKPKQLASDSEGGLLSTDFIKLLKDNNIKHTLLIQKAPYAEVFIRTIKQTIYNRLEGENKNVDMWVDTLPVVLGKYNLSNYSRLPNFSPYEATQPKNKPAVMFHNYLQARHEVKYPRISINDEVRVKIKHTSKTKATDPKWSREVYKVVDKKDNECYVDTNTRKAFLRNELLKIN